MSGEFRSPADESAHSTERVRDMMDAIRIAALGHAAALYETNRDRILEAAKLADGTPYRCLRIVKPDCSGCKGSGVRFAIEDHPRKGAEQVVTVGPRGVRVTPSAVEAVGIIRECECVRYELHTLPAPAPEETESVR